MENTVERRLRLLNKFTTESGFNPVHAFEFEGVIFLGEYIDSLKMYADSNDSRPFYIWLHDTHTILVPSKNVKH